MSSRIEVTFAIAMRCGVFTNSMRYTRKTIEAKQ